MLEIDQQIDDLEKRLDALVRGQIDFQREVSFIKGELRRLRATRTGTSKDRSFYSQPEPKTDIPLAAEQPQQRPPLRETVPEPSEAYTAPGFGGYAGPNQEQARPTSPVSEKFSKYKESTQADFEKFIGENLISKIGILILIIGVGIGVKYSIDNDLISPSTRVIVGYVFGLGLVGLAIKLKPKYLNFSAVLVSGGMAIMYFVTYFAHTLYALIGQTSAFGLMAMFTAFTVAAALIYNRQVIAHIGLVGAYGVPFLLSNNSGNYLFLFTYVAIINAGILAISVKRNWKALFYTSSGFTWLIFAGWFATRYSADHFELAITFLAIFFAIFFATKFVHRLVYEVAEDVENMVSSVFTTGVFYIFCFSIGILKLSDLQLTTFFIYLAISSAAVVLISFRVFGKPLVYLSFASVWLTYAGWYGLWFNAQTQFVTAVTFAAIFFAVFYVTTLIYRLRHETFSVVEHSGMVLTNSFLFYGFGYSILDGREFAQNYLGLYTAAHSGMHLFTAALVSRIRSTATDIVQVLTVLVLTFATVAIPVQFDGNFVTMIWAVEAALLFWFGRKRRVEIFEYFSYPVMALATGSLFLDWAISFSSRTSYPSDANLPPLWNGDFVTAIVFLAAFALILSVDRDKDLEPAIGRDFATALKYGVAGVGLFVLYNMLRIEIDNCFHLRSVHLLAAAGDLPSAPFADNGKLNTISQIDYTMLFATVLAFVNLQRIRSAALALVNIVLGVFVLFILATVGMILFDSLRQSYMSAGIEGPSVNVAIRYLSYLFACGLFVALYRYSRDSIMAEYVPNKVLGYSFEAVAYTFIFIAASCELVNLMGQLHLPDATKLGLSILWGVYSLVLIAIGIAKDKKHLRFAAITLLAITLVKLFFYDIADLPTIPKTILFVSLGILLLIVSFLYTKFRPVIIGRPDDEKLPI